MVIFLKTILWFIVFKVQELFIFLWRVLIFPYTLYTYSKRDSELRVALLNLFIFFSVVGILIPIVIGGVFTYFDINLGVRTDLSSLFYFWGQGFYAILIFVTSIGGVAMVGGICYQVYKVIKWLLGDKLFSFLASNWDKASKRAKGEK